MTKDYSTNLATAKRLVQKFGRQVTLVKLDASTPDVDKPWLQQEDPTATPAASTEVYVAAVPPSSAVALGLSTSQADLLKSVEQIFIAEPGDAPLEQHHVLVDGGVEYKIKFLEKLRPAETTLLYFIGVGR